MEDQVLNKGAHFIGTKGTKMFNISVFDHLGPFLAHLDPFGPFQTKMIFLPQRDKVGFDVGASEQKINFCLKWSKSVQMGPKGSQMVKTVRLAIFYPFGPLWNVDKPAMFGPKWTIFGPFPLPSHERWTYRPYLGNIPKKKQFFLILP